MVGAPGKATKRDSLFGMGTTVPHHIFACDLPDFDAYTSDVNIRRMRALCIYEIYSLNLRVVPGLAVTSEAPSVRMLSSIQSPSLLPGTLMVRPKGTALRVTPLTGRETVCV